MENPKLSSASPYSYSLFQGGKSYTVSGISFAPRCRQVKYMTAGSRFLLEKTFQQCFLLPRAAPKVTFRRWIHAESNHTGGLYTRKATVTLRARLGAEVPCWGNLENTPAQIFCTRNAEAWKGEQKEMLPTEKVLNCWKIRFSLKPPGWGRDNEGG